MARKPVKKRLRSSTGNSGKTVGPKKRGRVENLKPFLPGTSGNPEGRPKTAALSAACRDKLAHLVPDDPHGRTYAQVIADRLGVELSTVRTYLKRIFGKLGVHRRSEVPAMFARRR